MQFFCIRPATTTGTRPLIDPQMQVLLLLLSGKSHQIAFSYSSSNPAPR
jgi:hypothetical protein